jgi:hypothetical protein
VKHQNSDGPSLNWVQKELPPKFIDTFFRKLGRFGRMAEVCFETGGLSGSLLTQANLLLADTIEIHHSIGLETAKHGDRIPLSIRASRRGLAWSPLGGALAIYARCAAGRSTSTRERWRRWPGAVVMG